MIKQPTLTRRWFGYCKMLIGAQKLFPRPLQIIKKNTNTEVSQAKLSKKLCSHTSFQWFKIWCFLHEVWYNLLTISQFITFSLFTFFGLS